MVGSALALIVMAFFARGAADSVRYSTWTPTIGGVIFSLPLLVAGVFLVRLVRQRTRRPFLLQRPRVYLGVLGLLVWVALGWAYVLQVGNESTYQASYNARTQRWEANFSQRSFFALTLGMALVYPTGASIAAARFLYLNAIKPVADTVEGSDPIGEIMAGNPPSDVPAWRRPEA